MISFITTGRDDNYGGSIFIDRLLKSISTNVETLKQFDIDYEYLVVEWSPINEYLSNNEKFKTLFSNNNVIDIAVKQSVAVQEGLNPAQFYEYFAKNVGVRMSKYDMLIILNSDIVIPFHSMQKIVELYNTGISNKYFYRFLFRTQVNNELIKIRTECVHYPNNADAVICGYCSGDILIVSKEVFVNAGRAYDETNHGHRTISQTGMDGEILWNMHKRGITLEFIDSEYYHINHSKDNVHTDGIYNMGGYENKSDWGFINYPVVKINEKLFEIG